MTNDVKLPDIGEEVEHLNEKDLQAETYSNDAAGNGKTPPKAKRKSSSKEKQPEPLFRGRPVDVLGVTGDYNTGKTLFLLSISPKETRYYDFEKSGAGHAVSLGATRVDVPSVMQAKFRSGYKPAELFAWWYDDVRKLSPGEYRVIAVDTIGDIETGLADYVAHNLHKENGYKTPESFQAMGGVFWGAVKAFWKRVLSDVASRCETFVFSSHLKVKYKGTVATKEKSPAGKSTLMELASLYIWLERDQSEVPSGRILKSRLSDASIVDGRLVAVDILPPRMPEASYHRICWYCDNPAGSSLRDDERVTEHEMTEDERLELRREIAENERAAEEARLAAVEAGGKRGGRTMTKKSKAEKAEQSVEPEATVKESKSDEAKAKATSDAPPKSDSPPKQAKAEPPTAEKPVEPTSPPKLAELPDPSESATTNQLRRVKYLKEEIGLTDAQYKSVIAEFGVKSARELTTSQCDSLLSELTSLFTESDVDKWARDTLSPKA